MRLFVNGDETLVPDGLTIALLLSHLQLKAGPVAVELNGDVVPRARHAETLLADEDRLEIVHFVGGG